MGKNQESISGNDILNCRLEFFALAAIWIVLFHLQMYADWESSNIVEVMLHKFFNAGSSGVDIFLFFSGAGLFYSMRKNATKEFYKNRFFRIAFSYFSVAGCYYFWDNFIYTKDGVLFYILDLSTFAWWINKKDALWYMSVIVALYLIFPLLFKWNQKAASKSTLGLMIGVMLISVFLSIKGLRIPFNILDTKYEKFISRVPIFLLGLYTAANIEKSERVPIKSLACLTVLSGGYC
ncbi:MAG: acyltransferase family protein [Clostridium sp.]|nr:acyltransferase family protein [Clostridium sp.]